MADFEIAYKLTAQIEGGYANDPDDKGGETYAGIARKSWPNWTGWAIVDQYKAGHSGDLDVTLKTNPDLQQNVKQFYQTNYWNSNRLGEVQDQRIANELYDIGVNMGTGRAAEFLQRALNVANINQKAWPDMVIDRVIGVNTLSILNTKAKAWEILKLIGALQGAKYIEIVEKDPTQEKFIASWMSRFGNFN